MMRFYRGYFFYIEQKIENIFLPSSRFLKNSIKSSKNINSSFISFLNYIYKKLFQSITLSIFHHSKKRQVKENFLKNIKSFSSVFSFIKKNI